MSQYHDVAVFVDAGYLYGCGQRHLASATDPCGRSELGVHPDRVVKALVQQAKDYGQLLRTYWYDGTRPGELSEDLTVVADLPGVKLRLGRLAHGHQKGVDTLLVRDLLVLSAEKTIATALVVTGDDDFLEAVTYAQERGVRVVLLAFPDAKGKADAAVGLQREADEVVLLDQQLLEEVFELAGPPAPPPPDQRPPWMEKPHQPSHCEGIEARSKGFAKQWVSQISMTTLRSLLEGRPTLPHDVDAPLIRAAGGGRDTTPQDRQLARDTFWAVVESA